MPRLQPAPRAPDICPRGHQTTHVLNRRRRRGYLARQHACTTCGARWVSYQTLRHPKHIHPAPTK